MGPERSTLARIVRNCAPLLLAMVTGLLGCQRSTTQEATATTAQRVSAPPAAVKPGSAYATWIRFPQPAASLSPLATLGKALFFDQGLSASGRQSCASCHDPAHAYGPPNGLAVQLGGPELNRQGGRATPSLRYLGFTPRFSRHFMRPSPDGVEDEGPAGGFMRDGSADTLHQQAVLPMLNPNEMANRNAAEVVARLQRSASVSAYRMTFGDDSMDDPARTLANLGLAIEAFETEDPSFAPYTSKFDAVLAGNANFTEAEERGYKLFTDARGVNCAKCHTAQTGPGGRPPQFTDYGFVALGVPRNMELLVNRNANFFDLGLCKTALTGVTGDLSLCGMFKTPTLRNVATRETFFHNGYAHTLDAAVRFYIERDTLPAKWYPRRGSQIVTYDDLPPKMRANVDHVDAPFNRPAGALPALDEQGIADVLAFLRTLNDGYSTLPGGPAR